MGRYREVKDCSRCLVLEVHSEGEVVALGIVREIAQIQVRESANPLLMNKAVVDVERIGFPPLVIVAGPRLLSRHVPQANSMFGPASG